MDKLTVQLLTTDEEQLRKLYDYLQGPIDAAPGTINRGVHNRKVEITIHERHTECSITGWKVASQEGVRKGEWLQALAEALADYIVDTYEEELLLALMQKEPHLSLDGAEALTMLKYCQQMLSVEDESEGPDEPQSRSRRRHMLAKDISSYLKHSDTLNLEGLIRFRTPRYKAELKDVLEYASDEFLMDRQYKEFISLLRYFVYIQEAKVPEAHLMHKGGHEFVLLNEQMKPIETDSLDTSFKVEFLDKDFSFEDLIVSTLVTLAPERIYIHTREPELSVIQTIGQIFESRSQICEYCCVCKPFLGDMNQQDKRFP